MNNYYFSKKNLEQNETPYTGYLLKELSKLKNSSIEAVDDFEDLLRVINDPALTEFQYLVDGDDWTVSVK